MAAKANGKTNGNSSGGRFPQGSEVKLDKLGRRVHPNRLKNLEPHKFPPGVSGNPGGSYKSRPFIAAIAQCAEMTVEEVATIKPTDPAPLASIKATFREGIKGKHEATKLLIHTYEGTPTQRLQFENVPGTTFAVENTVVDKRAATEELIETIREIYGLNYHARNRAAAVSVSVSSRVDRRLVQAKDRDQG